MKSKMLIRLAGSGAAVTLALSLTACGIVGTQSGDVIIGESETKTESEETGCVDGCACTDCACCGTDTLEAESDDVEVKEDLPKETESESQEEDISVKEAEAESTKASELSEEELSERREQQANFAAAREQLYALPNSVDKTEKINQMDRQILANNAYDFSDDMAVFIGDSITEGIANTVDQNGNFESYVTFANSYLHFGKVLNHGKGGRMFAAYGGDELSIAMNFDNIMNIDSNIVVVFAGVNDYLSTPENKHFGSVEDTHTTGNYCGAVRYFMNKLKTYYSDKEIFFVTMYDINRTVECDYADYDGQPTLGDFMDAEKELAAEFGFHVIDLYGTGFMDCSTQEAADYYLSDGLHPKDSGSIVLGEHIAAELSLYFSQQSENTGE